MKKVYINKPQLPVQLEANIRTEIRAREPEIFRHAMKIVPEKNLKYLIFCKSYKIKLLHVLFKLFFELYYKK